MFDDPKVPWETREDARALIQAEAVKSDPERLAKAQAVIRENARITKAAMGAKSALPSRRNNPATIGRIKHPK